MFLGIGVDESALTNWHIMGRKHAQQHVDEKTGYHPLFANDDLFPQDRARTKAYAQYLCMYRLTMSRERQELGEVKPLVLREKTSQAMAAQVA